MDISATISSAALASTAEKNGDAITVSVLKKAMDIEVSSEAQLLESVEQSTRGLPDNLGRNLNVKA